MTSDLVLSGSVIDGKYQVQSLLGRGGMGAVFRAVHLGTDRTVALKVISPGFAGDQEYVERFRREARACGRLRHPGIVDVTDFGVATHDGAPLPYLVMEFLDGRTLADALRDEPRPPLPWTIDILEQVCAAVEEAHAQGILHRDLKPENVWLEPDRRGGELVKVLDFGLAKLDGAEPASDAPRESSPSTPAPPADLAATFLSRTVARTMAGGSSSSTGVAGTPAYMSPEQARGEAASTRSDVYSIGVMAYRMIAGRLPFEGTIEETLTMQQQREAPPLRSVRPDVHDDAARLVELALSKDPARRPASAGVFGNMLAGQLEPAGAFFTRAFMLYVSRLWPILKIGLIACSPILVVSLIAAGWQGLAQLSGLPLLSGRAAIVVLGVLFVLSTLSQTAIGVMPLFVLHAIAEPARPLDVGTLVRTYRHRLRRWTLAMLPFIGAFLGVFALFGLMVLVIDTLEPTIRQWPRPVRLAVVLPVVLSPFLLAFLLIRRSQLGFRELALLGAVMLIEDLAPGEAGARSRELMAQSGGLRAAVQKGYMTVVMVTSLLLGAVLGATGMLGRSPGMLLALSPLVIVLFVVVLTVNAVIGALMYLSARRSKGESLDHIFAGLIRG